MTDIQLLANAIQRGRFDVARDVANTFTGNVQVLGRELAVLQQKYHELSETVRDLEGAVVAAQPGHGSDADRQRLDAQLRKIMATLAAAQPHSEAIKDGIAALKG